MRSRAARRLRAALVGSALGLGVIESGPSAFALELRASPEEPAEVHALVNFSVEISNPIGEPSIEWSFGDGQVLAAGAKVSHRYERAGHYPVIVKVRDATDTRAVSFLQTVHYPLTDRQPSASSSIVYDAGRRAVYVTNPDNDSVALIDALDFQKLAEIRTFKKPTTLALAPNGRLYVAHQDDFVIAIVDPDQRELVGAIPLPYASQPAGLLIGPRGDALFVALRATGELARIDLSTQRVSAVQKLGASPQALAISADGRELLLTRFISARDHADVYEVDAGNFQKLSGFSLASDPGPDTDTSGRGVPNYLSAIAISPDGQSAWLAAKKDNTARGLFVDGNPLTPENTVRSTAIRLSLGPNDRGLGTRVDLDNRNLPSAVCFSELGDFVFIVAQGNNLVMVLDAYSGEAVSAIAEVGAAPVGLALSSDGKLFVQALISRSVSVFDVAPLLRARDFRATKLAEIRSIDAERLAPDVLEGKRVFYDSNDPRMSRQGYLSCASCHLGGLEDGRVYDFSDRGEGLRNTSTLIGRRGTGQGRLHWTGNFDEVQDFEADIRSTFGGTGFMPNELYTSGTRSQPLGDAKAGSSAELDALASYLGSLEHVNRSPFRNSDGTLTDAALEGQKLFSRLQCGDCHAGPDFTDSASGALHDVGTIGPGSGKRLGAELTGFDTPTLLGVWESAPYLHDGSAQTLRDVLTTRNPNDRHGVTSGLGEAELSALEAYLLELDSELEIRTLPTFDAPEPEPSGCACGVRPRPGRAPAAWICGLVLFFRRRRRPRRPA